MTDAWSSVAAIRNGSLSAREAVENALTAIDRADGAINAFTVLTPETALAQADEVDRGQRAGRLAGLPISVKDHVWLAGVPATNGSRALADFVPDTSCACVARLVDDGAIVVGKTNNPEFCYRGVTENELWGTTRNPRDHSRTAGGSSGGAAASVAAGMVPLAVGTDGGGSIRIPSAFCGTYGHKPSFGLVPKLPGFRGWPTLSVTGPIAASVRDLALALTVMAGPSALDYLSAPSPPADYLAAVLQQTWDGVRVGVSDDLGYADLDPDVRSAFRAAIDRISAAGAAIVERHPATVDPSPLWDSIALPEGYASEGTLVEANPDRVGADAAAITLAGKEITASAYLDAQHEREQFAISWAEFFRDVDVLLTPTMPVTAFDTGRLAPPTIAGKRVPESFDAWCVLALPANLAGLPATTIPIPGGRDGLPVGLQIMGPRWSDATVLRVAALADAEI